MGLNSPIMGLDKRKKPTEDSMDTQKMFSQSHSPLTTDKSFQDQETDKSSYGTHSDNASSQSRTTTTQIGFHA